MKVNFETGYQSIGSRSKILPTNIILEEELTDNNRLIESLEFQPAAPNGSNPAMTPRPHPIFQWDMALQPVKNFAWADTHWAIYSTC